MVGFLLVRPAGRTNRHGKELAEGKSSRVNGPLKVFANLYLISTR